MGLKDPVLSAIDDFKGLLDSLKNGEKSKVGESFRSRCRELPSLIEDTGLVPALSFCYAKASKEYGNVRKALEDGSKIEDDNPMEKGYAIYLYFVLKMLGSLGLLDESHLSDPIEALREIRGKQRVASRLLRPYLIQLKRLSEAVFESEGEES
ncbi:MAG: type III-B CRISPR module-associated protein Cmr5 [Candidatus Korarchaeum sp.]